MDAERRDYYQDHRREPSDECHASDSRPIAVYFNWRPRDPETGEEDFAAFDAMQEELIEKMPLSWQRAYAAKLSLPREFASVERQIKAAQDARDELYDIPKYRGISVEDSQAASELSAKAGEYQDAEEERTGRRPSLERALNITAETLRQKLEDSK